MGCRVADESAVRNERQGLANGLASPCPPREGVEIHVLEGLAGDASEDSGAMELSDGKRGVWVACDQFSSTLGIGRRNWEITRLILALYFALLGERFRFL